MGGQEQGGSSVALDSKEKEQLKDWLVKTLEPVSDADPDVLSKYVLALVQADPLKEDIDEICISKLEEFLGDETQSFVSKLVQALRNGSYRKKDTGSTRKRAQEEGDSSSKRHRSSDQQHPSSSRHRGGGNNGPDDRERRSHSNRRDSRQDRRHPSEWRGPPGGWDGPPPRWSGPPPHHHNAYMQQHHHPHHPFPPMQQMRGPPKFQGWSKRKTEEESKLTLVAKNVDPKYVNISKFIGHFARFGEVINVQMRPKHKAGVVQFTKEDDATRAFQSPMPVCNNRFIKLSRAHFDLDEVDATDQVTEEEKKKEEQNALEMKEKAAAQGKEVLEQKRQLLDKQKELLKQKETLLQNQLDQHQTLLDKMKEMNTDPLEQEQMSGKITQLKTQLHTIQVAVGSVQPDEKLTSLKNELSELQSQAAAVAGAAYRTASRGRGGLRGRGAPGRGNNGARGSISLDNRTTILKVEALPEPAQDQSVLQQHFATFGAITKVAFHPEQKQLAFIVFADRYGAQNAKQHGSFYGEAALNVSWIEAADVPKNLF